MHVLIVLGMLMLVSWVVLVLAKGDPSMEETVKRNQALA